MDGDRLMPYDTLPQRYRDLIPGKAGQGIFRNTLNAQLAAGKDEDVAFASAWAALERAGYAKDDKGKWVKKTQPTLSQVHVPGAMGDDEDDKARTQKAYGAEPIYMYQPVLNAEQIIEWAAAQGFTSTLLADDMHVTVVFSRTPFSAEYTRIAAEHGTVLFHNVVVRGGKRTVTPLGDKGAVVLKIESDDLQGEHREFRRLGASWDYQEYTPHITITYSGQGLDPRNMTPFAGDIVLGPLRAKPMKTNWDSVVVETPTAKRLRAAVETLKRLMTDDSFTTREEAVVRSYDLGLEGAIHVYQTADGQAVYMPGEDHEHYLEHMAERAGIMEPEDDEDNEDEGESDSQETLLQQVISAILAAVIDKGSPVEKAVTKTSDILKVDSERRIVWGWASVSTMKGELVTDLQGDRIAPSEMEKMADRFMRSARAAKAMHMGGDVGEVIHSFPLTKELADAFGIQTDREGWITGTYVKSDAEWAKVLKGEYRGLSIGGRSKRKEVK